MQDLAQEFLDQGHDPVVLAPMQGPGPLWVEEKVRGVRVLRLRAWNTKGNSYLGRTLAELALSVGMLRGLWISPLRKVSWDGLVWYSPSVFLGPFIWWLKSRSRCQVYVILRDIFPEWLVELGVLRKGPVYYFFKLIAHLQYMLADCIGVQSPSNQEHLSHWSRRTGKRLEVLQNWLAPAPDIGSSISVANSPLAGRIILVYVGTMGVAQGAEIFVDLAKYLRHRDDLGFLFVGKGAAVPKLVDRSREYGLENTLFHAEINSEEIPGLLSQCAVGLLALDPRHRTHHIPGKFLTYVQAGLPVLARVNHGTDLVNVIENEGVGIAYTGESVRTLGTLTEDLVDNAEAWEEMSKHGKGLARRVFSPTTACEQILEALSPEGVVSLGPESERI